jgi:hypothetical protein
MKKWLTQCGLNWLQYLRKTLRLTFAEGVALLKVGTSMSNWEEYDFRLGLWVGNLTSLSLLVLQLMTDTIWIQEAGVKVDPMADFNTETEKTLGKIVKEK